MSIRKRFISLSSPFTSVLPLGVLTALTGQQFIIPFYHIVSDGDCPHVRHLYRFKSVKEFETDLDYLTRHYQPIGAVDLSDVVAGKYAGKKIMLLTFDDGLREMHDIVAPILLRKGIPAIFFLNNDFIDNRALMFRYKVSLAKEWGRSTQRMFDSKTAKQFQQEIDISLTQRFDTFLKDYQPYMTSKQIMSLLDKGFSIGSHSCDHPYYSTLTLEEQLKETLSSMDGLQKDFDLQERLFAFPFTDDGVSNAFFDKIFNEGKVDFSFGGAGIKEDTHPRHFQRIPMEGWDTTAEQTLKSEYLYYLLRMPLFKNQIKRN